MYDVICGEVWEDITKNLAQTIARESRGDRLTGRDWQRFARECGLNPKQVLERVGALAKSVISEAPAAESEVAAMPAGRHEILVRTREAVERRARTLLALLPEVEAIRQLKPAKVIVSSPPQLVREFATRIYLLSDRSVVRERDPDELA